MLPIYNPQQLSSTIWALATLGHRDDGFTSALILEARSKLPMYNPQQLSNTLWALATVGHHDDGFTSALISEAQAKLPTFNPQDLANTLWALAVFCPNLQSQTNPSVVSSLISAMSSNISGLTDRWLRQLFMFFLGMKDQCWETGLIPIDLWDMGKSAWISNMSPNPSKRQLDVLKVIKSLPECSKATGELLTEDGFFSIDIALIRADGTKVAIEVDGPTHFTSNDPKRMNGATMLRNRFLEARGWRVVSVPVEAWSGVPRGGKEQYLMDLLEAVQPVRSAAGGLRF
jgi:hypothetical protein